MKSQKSTMKIFDRSINPKSKTVTCRIKVAGGQLGYTKYFPSFSKEWRNTIYCYNKNLLKNIPSNDLNINKVIKGYFNLHWNKKKFNKKFAPTALRRSKFLKRIFVSNAEIKHTNNKAIITLYTINREKKILKKKYEIMHKKMGKKLLNRYFWVYKKRISTLNKILAKYKYQNKAGASSALKLIFISDIIRKKNFIKYKFEYLNNLIKLKHNYLKKMSSIILNNIIQKKLKWVRKYDLLYSLNQYKFNKLMFLPKLSNILTRIIGKKIEYNIINLKSITYNTDLFTNALALKLQGKKKIRVLQSMKAILRRAPLITTNSLKERSPLSKQERINAYMEKYRDLKLVSNIGNLADATNLQAPNNFSNLLKTIYDTSPEVANYNDKKKIHKTVFNSIRYKNMSGIRLEVSGRLTKRYRADRALSKIRWRGGLRNIDSSYQRLNTVLFRGNTEANLNYSWSKSKRRIGSFAVKGWIAGNK